MKFTPSMMGAASGKLGGVVASRNKGGQYFRRNSMPTNPQTEKQTANRTNFGAWVVQWQSESETDRQSWEDWAQNVPFVDSLGQTYKLSGQQAYLRANTAVVSGGPGPFQTAPSTFDNGVGIVGITSLTVGAAAGQIDYDLSIGAGGASEEGAVVIYISRPQNVSKNFFKGPYQLALVDGGLNALDTDIAGADVPTLMDWALVEDNWVHVRARIVYADGRVSLPWQGWALVGANVP
jgi:hypothetical protein